MDENDKRIVAALGGAFERFQKLALMVKEQPKTRRYAESEMKRMLEAMSEQERSELRQALKDAGAWSSRRLYWDGKRM